MKNLIYSSNKVDFDTIEKLETPAPMGTRHVPIPHAELIDLARTSLEENGFTVEQEEHGLSEHEMNCFSGFAISKPDFKSDERKLVMGLRNSHNQKFASSVAIGSTMMVCENLCFSSDVKLARKHTQNIFKDLPLVLNKAIGAIQETWDLQGQRIEAYKDTEIDEVSALNKLLKAGLIKSTKIGDVFDLIENGGLDVNGKKGAFSEFKGTIWNVYNAVTESYKHLTAQNLMHLPSMTMRVQQTLDSFTRGNSIISNEDKKNAVVLPA
jgi:hypothetical protein